MGPLVGKQPNPVSSSVFEGLAQKRTLPTCSRSASPLPFTHAFLINVDHASGRERFSLMSAQLNRSCVPWQLWPGVVPRNETFIELNHFLPKSFRVDPGLYYDAISDHRRRGMLGNYLSHMSLWSHLVHRHAASPDEAYLILEDDLWFAPNWVDLLRLSYGRVPTVWEAIQLVWFGMAYESARVNVWVDRVRSDGHDLASAWYPNRWKADDPHLTKGCGAYLGLQATLYRLPGMACLLSRLPQQYIQRMTAVDSMSRNANCSGRYAVRSGMAEGFNWGNVENLAWHNALHMAEKQRAIYQLS